MRLFSYVIVSDSGFAPNPFWGLCTLATCKPVIRRTAEVGDWVAGLSPKASGNRLVYAMQVTDKIPMDAYFADARFQVKKPDMGAALRLHQRGDNIYEPSPAPGQFRQLPSLHSHRDGSEDLGNKRWDLGGMYVLISDRFWYFGGDALELPEDLRKELEVGRGHRNRFPASVVDDFVRFITEQPSGVHGRPTKWDPSDESWRGLPG